jgi:DNA-binding transcriptional MocR family regulator
MVQFMGAEATRYERVAALIEDRVRNGVLRVGDRVPSLRSLSRHQRVSIGTVLEAYVRLEARGVLEARPRSGFFVRVPHADSPPEPHFHPRPAAPARVGANAVITAVMNAATDPHIVPLGAACPSPDLLPYRALNRCLRGAVAGDPLHTTGSDPTRGAEALRRQIARRALLYGCDFTPADVIVTCGATEALQLSLRATTRPGQLVALESPTYFGILQVVEALGLRAIEVPTHPRGGLDLGRLAGLLRAHPIAACVAMPTLQNPLGATMPLAAKRELVTLLARHEIPLIEDDVHGDLVFEVSRPAAAKSFDRRGLVLYCGSFSKTLGPGLRVGWLEAGRFTPAVERLKLTSTMATASLPQAAIARFLERGSYERHLRRLRRALSMQMARMSAAIAHSLPTGTRVSRPAGGFVLWVELPEGRDAVALHRHALDAGISVSPGPIFSASGRFKRMLRINCGHPWSPQIERAVATLGRLAG